MFAHRIGFVLLWAVGPIWCQLVLPTERRQSLEFVHLSDAKQQLCPTPTGDNGIGTQKLILNAWTINSLLFMNVLHFNSVKRLSSVHIDPHLVAYDMRLQKYVNVPMSDHLEMTKWLRLVNLNESNLVLGKSR